MLCRDSCQGENDMVSASSEVLAVGGGADAQSGQVRDRVADGEDVADHRCAAGDDSELHAVLSSDQSEVVRRLDGVRDAAGVGEGEVRGGLHGGALHRLGEAERVEPGVGAGTGRHRGVDERGTDRIGHRDDVAGGPFGQVLAHRLHVVPHVRRGERIVGAGGGDERTAGGAELRVEEIALQQFEAAAVQTSVHVVAPRVGDRGPGETDRAAIVVELGELSLHDAALQHRRGGERAVAGGGQVEHFKVPRHRSVVHERVPGGVHELSGTGRPGEVHRVLGGTDHPLRREGELCEGGVPLERVGDLRHPLLEAVVRDDDVVRDGAVSGRKVRTGVRGLLDRFREGIHDGQSRGGNVRHVLRRDEGDEGIRVVGRKEHHPFGGHLRPHRVVHHVGRQREGAGEVRLQRAVGALRLQVHREAVVDVGEGVDAVGTGRGLAERDVREDGGVQQRHHRVRDGGHVLVHHLSGDGGVEVRHAEHDAPHHAVGRGGVPTRQRREADGDGGVVRVAVLLRGIGLGGVHRRHRDGEGVGAREDRLAVHDLILSGRNVREREGAGGVAGDGVDRTVKPDGDHRAGDRLIGDAVPHQSGDGPFRGVRGKVGKARTRDVVRVVVLLRASAEREERQQHCGRTREESVHACSLMKWVKCEMVDCARTIPTISPPNGGSGYSPLRRPTSHDCAPVNIRRSLSGLPSLIGSIIQNVMIRTCWMR